MTDKKSVQCHRCSHTSGIHKRDGMHECLFHNCDCAYFILPVDVDDINTPDNVEIRFEEAEVVSTQNIFNQTLSKPINLESNYRRIAIDLGMDPELIESSLRDLENRTVKPVDSSFHAVVQTAGDAFRNARDEIRTVASTGAEKGVKEARYDLIPVPALDLLARLYGKGAAKYAAHNWRKGYEWSKSYAAAQRHMTLFWEGEDIDPEMQIPHVICAAFHMFALATYLTEHPEMDDRFHTVMAREARPDEEETPALTTADILEELANDYINRGDSRTAETLLAVARDEKVK